MSSGFHSKGYTEWPNMNTKKIIYKFCAFSSVPVLSIIETECLYYKPYTETHPKRKMFRKMLNNKKKIYY